MIRLVVVRFVKCENLMMKKDGVGADWCDTQIDYIRKMMQERGEVEDEDEFDLLGEGLVIEKGNDSMMWDESKKAR